MIFNYVINSEGYFKWQGGLHSARRRREEQSSRSWADLCCTTQDFDQATVSLRSFLATYIYVSSLSCQVTSFHTAVCRSPMLLVMTHEWVVNLTGCGDTRICEGYCGYISTFRMALYDTANFKLEPITKNPCRGPRSIQPMGSEQLSKAHRGAGAATRLR